ncbi:TRAP transporter large permease [Thalassospira sp. HF15]|uniref:TRAP transporter large permease n=1 Tax=Thalassospira sp. HF15 TaxID=2722755 RepID=UPI001431E94A|nr:TRAP transporter large permease [Thalassospira sp. HF15]NIY76768.1 TRAP transporter large permease [Thalassospira sp. HF15]
MMFSLMGLGVNVGLAMGISGSVGLYAVLGERALDATLSQTPFTTASSSTFIVLPMFIFMGLMLWYSGITTKLYAAAKVLFFWLPGNQAATTNIAGAGLGAISGSTVGSTYALGRIAIAEMLRNGYDKRLAVGSVLSAGTIGQLIPPSIMMVIFAGFAEVPVGPQLLAGTIPGILLTLAYVLTVVIVALAKPAWVGAGVKGAKTHLTGDEDSLAFGEKTKIVLAAWPVPVLIAVIFGGLGSGLLTVTECASVGAIGAVLYCFAAQKKEQFLKSLTGAARSTLSTVGSVLILLIGAAILSRLLAVTGAAQWLSANMKLMSDNLFVFFALLILLYLVLGMFMDAIAMMLLTVPLIMPIVVAAGYDPMWFGIFLVLMAEISILTPPVGLLVFIGHRMAQDPEINIGQTVSLKDVFVGVFLFVPLALAVVVLITVFPDLVTWLPEQASQ